MPNYINVKEFLIQLDFRKYSSNTEPAIFWYSDSLLMGSFIDISGDIHDVDVDQTENEFDSPDVNRYSALCW